ncbi:hypothetical protein ECTPHS_08653 [Ectothiorhodospira sp. PHS-1]|uniref:hypothetical protein n=1 Tax=Ectothiorhodospira sp. PHS-1 TaxID=519989 RepID=UPI00024A83B6|nr:hypothetical protein [Ectothiorhodospira sp. PHS-1]EHQ52747.1 hypothetical protein ECTPHS_08653 [Ectothiorhodospira sp. PHS-1]
MPHLKTILLSAILLLPTQALADQISGRVTTWQKTSQMSMPREVPADNVTVVAGQGLRIDINHAGRDTIIGKVEARATSDRQGNFSLNVPSGSNYTVIFWKRGHTPVTYNINAPGQINAQIGASSRSTLHMNLGFRQ